MRAEITMDGGETYSIEVEGADGRWTWCLYHMDAVIPVARGVRDTRSVAWAAVNLELLKLIQPAD